MDTQQSEYKRRAGAVRRRLGVLGIDGLIVVGLANVRYLTGFTGHDSWVLVLPRSVVLITDSRYTEQAAGECVNCRVVERKGGLPKEVEKILSKQKDISTIGIEDACSVKVLTAVRKTLSAKVKPLGPVVEHVRAVKTEAEVERIRKAGKIAFDAMDRALKKLRVGMTERQFAAMYEYLLSEYGTKPSFETIVAFGPNGSRNHHQPGPRKLKKTDMILLDFGAQYQGYCSDITRCFAVGKVTKSFQKAYETAVLAQQTVIEKIQAGAKGCDLDQAARDIIRLADLPVYGHGLGHGLGLEVHESPRMSQVDKKSTLAAGHIVTVEPGVYIPGHMGIRLEDDVLVTENGAVILTGDKRFTINPNRVPLIKI